MTYCYGGWMCRLLRRWAWKAYTGPDGWFYYLMCRWCGWEMLER